MASDDLRARIAEALRGIRFGLGTNARYGLSGNEVEAATEQLLPFVQAELDREQELSQLLMGQRQQMAAERFAWQERGDRAERELADWRKATYQHARERDEARAAVARAEELAAAWADPENRGRHGIPHSAAAWALREALTSPDTGEAEPERGYDLPAGFRPGPGGEQ